MIVGDPIGREVAEVFEGGGAVPVVEGIDDEAGIGFTAFIQHGDGVGDLVEAGEKADVFEHGADSGFTSDLEKIAVALGES